MGEGTDMTVLESVTSVFTEMANWVSTTLPTLSSIFYDAETGLTFIGTLSVAGLALSVFFLLMGVIQNFLHFRG